uniref:Putative zinc-or iron-chelating protein n=1 Tax=viral metagenome TaxID=1070528 RepID=A0A6M3L4T4_9ZZZZ
MTTLKFNCEKCGSCCKAVGCELLTKNNLCSIYEDRPDICRVDTMYEAIGGGLDRQQFYKLQKEACVKLRLKERVTNK